MLRKSLIFMLFCCLMACQKEESTTLQTNVSPDQSMVQITTPSHLEAIHPSILNSVWWQNLNPTNRQFIGLELAQDENAITLSELQRRIRQAQTNAGSRAGTCPGYPTANPAGDVTLNSQADVNTFGALNCKEIIGALVIIDTLGPDPICNLTPLKGIKKIGSSLTINADCLTSLAGLEKLKSIGQLGPFGFIGVNGFGLSDISALSKLSTITGSINIIDCDQLTSTGSAFSKITTIASGKTSAPLTSIFVLNINDNAMLTDISGFSNLALIEGGLRILSNGSLLDLDDLSGLNSIGEDIFIFENTSLQNVNELSNINSIADDIFVLDNPSLTQCCGLYNLLCNNPPSCTISGVGGNTVVFNNGAGCTDTDIITNGPCP